MTSNNYINAASDHLKPVVRSASISGCIGMQRYPDSVGDLRDVDRAKVISCLCGCRTA